MKNAGRTVGKRVIALLSVLCILCSLIVIPASAAETTATEDELVGTWVLNETFVFSSVKKTYQVNGTYHTLDSNEQLIEVEFDSINLAYSGAKSWLTIYAKGGYTDDNYVFNSYYTSGSSMALTGSIRVQYSMSYDRRIPNTDANFVTLRTFTITSNLADVTNGEALLTWLKANATKQGECPHDNTEIRNATDYYTGDTYCADCDELISSGTYGLSGWWILNENIVAPLSFPLVEDVPFSSYGADYTSLGWTGDDVGIYYGNTKVYDNLSGWTSDNYRTVNFGDSFIPVSKDFAVWFVANSSAPEKRSVKIYEDGLILDSSIVPDGSMLNITTTGFNIVAPNGTMIVNRVMSSSSNMLFCGLTADPDAEVATYGPGTTLKITQDLTYYMVIKETYNVSLYSQDGTFFDVIKCPVGQTAITINLGSLYFNLWNGNDFTYDLNLGAGEMVLGLSSSPSGQYAYDWGVGETIYVTGSTNLYIVKSYPYPVILNFNNGVDLNTFTGFQRSTIRVNDSSIDFVDYEGNVQSYSIPLNGTDDAFWGLATTPNQSTPEYVSGDEIFVYDTTELFLVRKSDYFSVIGGSGGGNVDSGSTPDQVVGDVPDVGDFVSDQAISSMSDIFSSVLNNSLFLSIFMISVILMFVSYVLFGKKN